MAVNKVIFGHNTLIDISDTTATASDVAVGKYIYGADGEVAIGTLVGNTINASGSGEVVDDTLVISGGSGGVYQDEDGYIVLGSEGGSTQSDITMTKIAEVTLAEDTHILSITTDSSWSEYDFLVYHYNLTLTETDWVYVIVDSTETTGTNYTAQAKSFVTTNSGNKTSTGFIVTVPGTTKSPIVLLGSTINYVPYVSTKNFVAGSSIKVYGAKYTGA